MRIRSLRAAAIVVVMAASGALAACSGGGTALPSCTASGVSTAATAAPGTSALKIGVVTDVGTVNDKNFNEYTFCGAKLGAAVIGAAVPPVTVPKDTSDYAAALQAYIDQKYDIIVTAGFNLGVATATAAHANPNIWFIGVDQGPPCLDSTGAPDTTFTKCVKDPGSVSPHYVAISYQEDQPGYLAGMVAASVSKSGTIGAIGGITLCGVCVRYIQGYQLGAQSINPNAVLAPVAWVTTSDFTKAFNDPDTGKNFGKQFLSQNPKVDVLFQVAGKTGNGVLDAACDAKIYGVGVDVDQALSYPNAAKCTVTSAEKKLTKAVAFDIGQIVAGAMKGGDDHWDAARDGIGYSPFHDLASVVPADMTAKLDAAFAQMKAGTLVTCPPPPQCGDIKTLPK